MSEILKKLETGEAFDVEEWAAASRRKEVCGIVGCRNEPWIKCSHCNNWYCREHQTTPGHVMNEIPFCGTDITVRRELRRRKRRPFRTTLGFVASELHHENDAAGPDEFADLWRQSHPEERWAANLEVVVDETGRIIE